MLKCRLVAIVVIVLYLSANFLLIYYQSSIVEKQDSNCNCPTALSIATTITSMTKAMTADSVNHSTQLRATQPSTVIAGRTPHNLAVLVPFRDRWEELIQFVPHMHNFLTGQNVSHEIWAIHQVDKHRFNRAMLMNTGYNLTDKCCDYLVMHDVDLLPLNKNLSYAYPEQWSPYHISAPELHPLYHYKKFVGGILMMTREHFHKVNGLTNIFWGWGREDDELYLRMKEAGLTIHRPVGITTGNKTFVHNHDKKKRPRDMKSYGTQWRLSRRRDRESGLNTLKFHLVSLMNITINGAPLKLANVELHCDLQKTPFCDHESKTKHL